MADKSIDHKISNKISHQIIDGDDTLSIWRGLLLRVSHEPQNLKLHTQRLLFALENDLSEYIPGALHDLFICLQDRGLPLKQRMFSLLSPVMAQTERAYFQRWLTDNTDKNLACFRYPGSVFKSETCQKNEKIPEQFTIENFMLDKNGLEKKRPFKNPLEESLFNLEQGQIIKARAQLEDICLQSDDEKAIDELQNIYRLTHNREALLKFTARFTDNGKPLPKKWAQLLETSNTWKE